MIWMVFWKFEGGSYAGFVKANTRNGAVRIANRKLQQGAIVTGCVEAHQHQITPQSITLNFQNTAEYRFFG